MKKMTAIAGFAVGLLAILEAILKTAAGPRPPLDAGNVLVNYMRIEAPWTLGVVLTDTVLMVALVVFFFGLAALIRQKGRAAFATTLGMASVIVFVVITVIGDSMDGGTALDATGTQGSAMAIRTLIEAHILLFGPIGSVFIAVILLTFSYASGAVRLIPPSLVRFGYAMAALNVIAVPMVYEAIRSLIDGSTIALAALVGLIAWVTLAGLALLLRNRA